MAKKRPAVMIDQKEDGTFLVWDSNDEYFVEAATLAEAVGVAASFKDQEPGLSIWLDAPLASLEAIFGKTPEFQQGVEAGKEAQAEE